LNPYVWSPKRKEFEQLLNICSRSDLLDNRRLLRVGIIGSVIAALCCFTTVLVSLLAVVGLSAAVGWLDYVLFPALFIFIGITIYAVHRRWKTATEADN